jgi:hypothetical protein
MILFNNVRVHNVQQADIEQKCDRLKPWFTGYFIYFLSPDATSLSFIRTPYTRAEMVRKKYYKPFLFKFCTQSQLKIHLVNRFYVYIELVQLLRG